MPQTVMLAKAHIVAHFEADASSLIDSFVAAMDARAPELVVVHPSVDSEPYIRQAGRYLAPPIGAALVGARPRLAHLAGRASHHQTSVRIQGEISRATAADPDARRARPRGKPVDRLDPVAASRVGQVDSGVQALVLQLAVSRDAALPA